MSVQVEVKKLRLPAAGVAEKCDKTILLRRCLFAAGKFPNSENSYDKPKVGEKLKINDQGPKYFYFISRV